MNLIFYTLAIELSRAMPVSHKENRKEGRGFQPSPGLRGEKSHVCRCCKEKGVWQTPVLLWGPWGRAELTVAQVGTWTHEADVIPGVTTPETTVQRGRIACQYRAQSHSNTHPGKPVPRHTPHTHTKARKTAVGQVKANQSLF